MGGKMKNILLAVLLCFVMAAGTMAGCGAAREGTAPEVPREGPAAEAQAGDGAVPGVEGANISRGMLIMEGELQLQVHDVSAVSGEVERLTKEEFNGFVAESSFAGRNGEKVARYTLRVPAVNFDAYMARIAELGEKKSRHTSAKDVTEEYIDLEARLMVLEAQETRLMELLAEVADLEDILILEQELFRVREPIERIQGRMDYLDRQVAYSTLRLVLEPVREPMPYPENVWEEFLFNFREGWRIFVSVIASIVGTLIYLWPFVLIAAGVLYWRWRRKRRQKSFPEPQKSE